MKAAPTQAKRLSKELRFLCQVVVQKRCRPSVATVSKVEICEAYMELFARSQKTSYAEIFKYLQLKRRRKAVNSAAVRKAISDLRAWFDEFYADKEHVYDQRCCFSEFAQDEQRSDIAVSFDDKGALLFNVDEILQDGPPTVRQQVQQLESDASQIRTLLGHLEGHIRALRDTLG